MTAGREPGKGDVAVGGRGLTHGAVDRDRVAVGIEVHAGRVGGDKQALCEPQATSTRVAPATPAVTVTARGLPRAR